MVQGGCLQWPKILKKTETKVLVSPRNEKENNVEQIIAAVKKSRQRFDLPAMLCAELVRLSSRGKRSSVETWLGKLQQW